MTTTPALNDDQTRVSANKATTPAGIAMFAAAQKHGSFYKTTFPGERALVGYDLDALADAALAAKATPAPNDDLVRELREADARWQKFCDKWERETKELDPSADQSEAFAAMRSTRDGRAASALEAQSKEIEALRAANDKLRRQSTDRAYMLEAYRNMLGPKGLEVAGMWAVRGVRRVHFDWSKSAGDMTGEDRAQAILDFEKAPRREVDPREIDGDLPRTALKGA